MDQDGKPKYGLVTTTKHDYQTFDVSNNIYVKLSPEEMQKAKTDSSFVFEKFMEYVNSKQKDNYVVQQTDVKDIQEYSANMLNRVSLEREQ